MVDHIISRKDFRFEPAQVKFLEDRARPGETIFYRNLVPMQYYLNHGALKYGAVLNLLLSRDPGEREKWLREHPPAFVVTGSPLWGLSDHKPHRDRPIYQRGGAYIPDKSGMTVSLPEPRLLADLVVAVEWPEGGGRISLKTAAGAVYTLRSAPREPGRLSVRAPEGTALAGFTLSGTRPFRLQGLSLNRSQATRWPWDRGVVMSTVPSSASVEARKVRFDSALMNPLPDKNLEILDDRGSSVLFRVVSR